MTTNRSGASAAPGGPPDASKLYTWDWRKDSREGDTNPFAMKMADPSWRLRPHLCPSRLEYQGAGRYAKEHLAGIHGLQHGELFRAPTFSAPRCVCRVTGNGSREHPIQVWACPLHRFPDEVLFGRPHTCPPKVRLSNDGIHPYDVYRTHGPNGGGLDGLEIMPRICGCTVVGGATWEHPLRPLLCPRHSGPAAGASGGPGATR